MMCIVKSAWLLWMAISVYHIVTYLKHLFYGNPAAVDVIGQDKKGLVFIPLGEFWVDFRLEFFLGPGNPTEWYNFPSVYACMLLDSFYDIFSWFHVSVAPEWNVTFLACVNGSKIDQRG